MKRQLLEKVKKKKTPPPDNIKRVVKIDGVKGKSKLLSPSKREKRFSHRHKIPQGGEKGLGNVFTDKKAFRPGETAQDASTIVERNLHRKLVTQSLD